VADRSIRYDVCEGEKVFNLRIPSTNGRNRPEDCQVLVKWNGIANLSNTWEASESLPHFLVAVSGHLTRAGRRSTFSHALSLSVSNELVAARDDLTRLLNRLLPPLSGVRAAYGKNFVTGIECSSTFTNLIHESSFRSISVLSEFRPTLMVALALSLDRQP
jgi:hypothetical protein